MPCGIHVDLNPIKAGEADSSETAPYTSVFQRIQARGAAEERPGSSGPVDDRTDGATGEQGDALAGGHLAHRPRASDMGIPPLSLDSYRRLLDWTARLIQSGERSTIPKDLAAILDHMNIEQKAWLDTVRGTD